MSLFCGRKLLVVLVLLVWKGGILSAFRMSLPQPLRRSVSPAMSGASEQDEEESHGRVHRRTTTNMFWPEHHDATFEGEIDEEEEQLSRVLDSILKIHCTHSEPDYLIPWQKQQQSPSTSSGFVIDIPGVVFCRWKQLSKLRIAVRRALVVALWLPWHK